MSERLVPTGLWTGRGSVRAAWVLWAVFAVGVSIIVVRSPGRTVTVPYREAAEAFVHSRPMYAGGKMGWLYPVQSAMMFVPFTFEPREVGEVLWRCVGIGALAVAVWRLTRRASPRGHDLFFLVSVTAVGVSLGAARNGQSNLHLAALTVLACDAIAARKWWGAVIWLSLALAVKPIAIVPVMLWGALHRPLWWRLPIGLAVVAALPFLHPDWGYVAGQYVAGLRKVVDAGDIRDFTEFHPADLTSLLNLVGVSPGAPWLTPLRAAAALAVLGLSWRATRLFDRTTAAVLALTLGCGYLMVFNPRTEANTYAMLGVGPAVLASWSLVRNRTSARSIGLTAACVLLASAQLFVPRQREYWIRPAETMVILAWLGAAICVPRWRRTIPTLPAGDSIETSDSRVAEPSATAR